ncbi:5-dehydro-2-deoxygluconokinase [Schaalia suimastitidis]|uniref:5-dehydro-2-deoxygluconokinase n=1 Tax=Schaalia suimastitidis TaxID=121163 RepID=UPI000418231B|nr:5-dehydro-2-deoxygluconokinase [Schaalia suimastitidis]
MSTAPCDFDLLAIGRSGVDIYPLQTGVGLEDVVSFGKFLGGSPANVAVAAARHGTRTALLTGVGCDPFGRFVRKEMRRLGVDDRYVIAHEHFNTPVTFCEIFPPDNFPLYFYREPSAPDLQLSGDHIPFDMVRTVPILWLSVTGLSEEPSRGAHHQVLSTRAREHTTILDLDYRSRFWGEEADAAREIDTVLPQVNIVIGNIKECEVAVGRRDAIGAADALLERGVDIAIVKQGPSGALLRSRDLTATIPAIPVDVYNGLGAGDAFGGAICHALLQGWELPRCLHFAAAAGAIVASRLECSTAMPTEDEVNALIATYDAITPHVTTRKAL